MDYALSRGAPIYAEIIGYGCSADVHHITASHPEGSGAGAAMQACLRDGNVAISDVVYVNAHATSTPLGDQAEARAISRIFHQQSINVGSNKGAIGHLLGAAGAVEAIFTVLSLKNAMVPPTLNFGQSDIPGLDAMLISHKVESLGSRKDGVIAVKNSFGFGGTNVAVCFKRM